MLYAHVYRRYSNCDKYFRVNGRDDACVTACAPAGVSYLFITESAIEEILSCFRTLAKRGNFAKRFVLIKHCLEIYLAEFLFVCRIYSIY